MAEPSIVFLLHPVPPGHWLRVPLGRGWVAEYRLVDDRGRIVFAELRVRPAGKLPRGGVDSSLTRTIKVGEHRRVLSELVTDHMADLDPEDLVAVEIPGGLFVDLPRRLLEPPPLKITKTMIATLAEEARSPAPRDELYFARIAARYVELVTAGNLRPTPIIATELGHPKSYVVAAIGDARKRGLLTATTRGRAGGQLTGKARRLLKQTEGRG